MGNFTQKMDGNNKNMTHIILYCQCGNKINVDSDPELPHDLVIKFNKKNNDQPKKCCSNLYSAAAYEFLGHEGYVSVLSRNFNVLSCRAMMT